MRNPVGRPLLVSYPREDHASCMEVGLAMRHEWIQSLHGGGSRSGRTDCPQERLRRAEAKSEPRASGPQDGRSFALSGADGTTEFKDQENTDEAPFRSGRSLFQEVFFFCTVKNVGDLPGTGCIYVETVVDRDTGIAFAKVYSAKNAMNAVDLLASRVVPFFDSRAITIKEVHTPKTSEYCGLLPKHPFETFLAVSHIQHLPMEQPGHRNSYLCEQFYGFLLKEFFPSALRRQFQLSLHELQKDLDTFVEAYNAVQMKRENDLKHEPQPSAKFPVDL